MRSRGAASATSDGLRADRHLAAVVASNDDDLAVRGARENLVEVSLEFFSIDGHWSSVLSTATSGDPFTRIRRTRSGAVSFVNANDGPPSEAYGRVSEPERYRVLHSAANRLVQDLVDDFDVVVHEGAALDPESAGIVEAERSVKLAPVSPAAAPITLALTSFPGVTVQFGRWEARSYPSCGCDACDEDPVELVHQLRRDVKAVVEGNFREELRGGLRPWKAMELWGDEWRSSHGGALKRREIRRLGPSGRHQWRPWLRRAPAAPKALRKAVER